MSAAGDGITLRKARAGDVMAIAQLVNGFAAERVMLARSAAEIELVLDDYVVATDARGRVLGCGALTEYSPSIAEVSSIAVARDTQRRGLGARIVERVEMLARTRGFDDVFLVTVTPRFFTAIGYREVSRDAYPEKRCASAEKRYMWRSLTPTAIEMAA